MTKINPSFHILVKLLFNILESNHEHKYAAKVYFNVVQYTAGLNAWQFVRQSPDWRGSSISTTGSSVYNFRAVIVALLGLGEQKVISKTPVFSTRTTGFDLFPIIKC